MKTSNTLIWLSGLIIVLALFAAGVGVFYQDGGSSFSFTTLRGNVVQVYGHGLYRYDTLIPALSFIMGDVVTLVLGIPLLVISVLLYRRGSLKGGLLLSGAFAYFLYNYGSMAFGAAYNNLFIVYLALLAASLFGFVLALTSFDLSALPAHFAGRLPRRGIGIYLIVSGVVLMLVWLVMTIIPALMQGQAPEVVESYTTFMTGVVDEAIVAPALIVAGALLLRRKPFGYLLSSALLVFTVVLGTSITLGGIAQLQAGVLAVGQFIGMTFSFTILTLFAIWFSVAVFRSFEEPASVRAGTLQTAKA